MFSFTSGFTRSIDRVLWIFAQCNNRKWWIHSSEIIVIRIFRNEFLLSLVLKTMLMSVCHYSFTSGLNLSCESKKKLYNRHVHRTNFILLINGSNLLNLIWNPNRLKSQYLKPFIKYDTQVIWKNFVPTDSQSHLENWRNA